jgi:hypothetical protein
MCTLAALFCAYMIYWRGVTEKMEKKKKSLDKEGGPV